WFARLFWVIPRSIPPHLCFLALVLSCTWKAVSDASLLRPIQVPSWSDGFLSASNSLSSSRSGVQRHLHRVADCILGHQITRLRHNRVPSAGFFPY
ncbi:hypothetical protein B0H14DRAFT_2915640, partial [Mycena olivaceomarginata]